MNLNPNNVGLDLDLNIMEISLPFDLSPTPPTPPAPSNNRYWVGGSGYWDNTAHWSTTSGGTPGASIPTTENDVIINTNSGFGSGGLINLSDIPSGYPTCHNFTSITGSSYSISDHPIAGFRRLFITGSLILEIGLNFSGLSVLDLSNMLGEHLTITTNGCNLQNIVAINIYLEGSNGIYTLQDDMSVEGELQMGGGIFDANDNNITAHHFYFYADIGFTPTIYMGSGNWNAVGIDDLENYMSPWYIEQYSEQSVIFIPETSLIWFAAVTTGIRTLFFYDDIAHEEGKRYNSIEISGDADSTNIIQGSNIFNNFEIGVNQTVLFTDDTIQRVNTLNVRGEVDNLINLNGTGTNGWYLDCTSGVLNCNYLNIDYSNASGGATFNAGSGSIDGGHNTGWNFAPSPERTLYWVGGSGNWSDATNHWSSESGGTPDVANLPTEYDTVFIDANSGLSGGTIMQDLGRATCHDFTSNTGFNYEIDINYDTADDDMLIYGNATFEVGLTFSIYNGPWVYFDGTDNHIVTMNGVTIEGFIFQGSGNIILTQGGGDLKYVSFTGSVNFVLQEDLIVSDTVNFNENSSVDADGYNITADKITTNVTPTIIMGSGTWEVTGTNWAMQSTAILDAGTSTVKCSTNGAIYFDGGSNIYNNVWFANAGGIVTVGGNNTFNNLKIDAGSTVKFAGFGGTNIQTVATLTAIGTVGNLITLIRHSTGYWTISCSSGVISCDYLDIDYSIATGGASFYAGANSTDDGHNTGWTFTAPP